jgi:glycosyltransferase involved in cell wall biosynthesis
MRPDVSVIVRARNEGAALRKLLAGIALQDRRDVEVILVDSGSTDDTRAIARAHGARVVTIDPAAFTFGRALNLGCAAARARICVIVSAHCVPANDQWLTRLLAAFRDRHVAGAYGKQLPVLATRAYELRKLIKAFPLESHRQTSQYFFHNANSAVRHRVWERTPFDEHLPGLEDRDWARRVLAQGYEIVYEPMAMVYHHHDETLRQIYHRYFREGQALRHLDPNFRQTLPRFLLNYAKGIQRDVRFVRQYQRSWTSLLAALPQRFLELYGTYRGLKDGMAR